MLGLTQGKWKQNPGREDTGACQRYPAVVTSSAAVAPAAAEALW